MPESATVLEPVAKCPGTAGPSRPRPGSSRGVTMRQNRRPGEKLFVDAAGTTVPVRIDG